MSAPAATLAEYSDHELAEWYGASTNEEWQAILCAEMARRDQADAAERDAQAAAKPYVRRDDPVRDEWERAAHSQYLQAERECNGELVSPGAPVASGWDLWSGPERRAMAYATEELRNFWLANPRITVTTYRAGVRGERQEWNDQLDRDETSAIRPGASQGQSPGGSADSQQNAVPPADARSAGQAGEVARPTARPGRDVRGPDRGGMTVGAGGFIARDAGRGMDRAALRESIRARASQSRGGAPRGHVAAEQDPARVITPAAAYGASGRAVALRDAGTVAGQFPDIDGAELLGHVRAYLGRFARFPSAAALDAAVLWAAHCHARDSEGTMIWPATPRLMLLSRERGSGKTTVLELLARIVPVCHGIDVEPSMAGVTYSLGREKAVVAIDESDILWGAGKRKADLRAVLNAGYTRHGTVLRMRGSKGERVPVFGPVMLAGLDVVEQATGGHLDTLLSRAVIIRMSAPAEGDELPDVNDPAEHAEATAERGRKLLAVWSLVRRDRLAAAQPELPEGVRLRAAQIWRPLLAVAEVAGGEWPERAAAACMELSQARDTPSDQTAELLDELAELTAGWD